MIRVQKEAEHVVGIGASAGGLDVLTGLVGTLPIDKAMSYVVLQHTAPEHRSMLVGILGRHTQLSVCEAEEGGPLLADTLYVVPARYHAEVRDGRFHLVDSTQRRMPHPSINRFFSSLAQQYGDRAIGIVLSGLGNDGAAGLSAIRAGGGLALVQVPASASFASMPEAAIKAGVATAVLYPEEIGNYLSHLSNTLATQWEQAPVMTPELMARLQRCTGQDFGVYRPELLRRRLLRRLATEENVTLAEYQQRLMEDDQEVQALARELLITVSAFFRDWRALRSLQRLVKDIVVYSQRLPDAKLRAWVAGCATGEEVYALAMLFIELLPDAWQANRIEIIATDVNAQVLARAERGVYSSAALANLSPERLKGFFDADEAGGFSVKPMLNAHLRFQHHNLTHEAPPWDQLDIIICRNVLHTLTPDHQRELLRRFHGALKPTGILVLGPGEGVARGAHLFAQRIGEREIFNRLAPEVTPIPTCDLPTSLSKRSSVALVDALSQQLQAVVAVFDLEGRLHYVSGAHVERLLRIAPGSSFRLIQESVQPRFASELALLTRRLDQGESKATGRIQLLQGEEVRLTLLPLEPSGEEETYRLAVLAPAFSRQEEPEVLPASPPTMPTSLDAAHAQLQRLKEQVALLEEEKQALREEAETTNEELQASNEEMEAANEELQTVNDELSALNRSVTCQAVELASLNSEYVSLYDSLRFPILVFDYQHRLLRFNLAARETLAISYADCNQRLASLHLPAPFSDMASWLDQAKQAAGEYTATLISPEQQPRHYQVIVTPVYHDAQPGDGRALPERLIVALLDVTDITRTQKKLLTYQRRLEALMKNTFTLYAVKDLKGRYLFANARFIDVFNLPDSYLGKRDFDLFPEPFAIDLWTYNLEALHHRRTITAEHRLTRANGEESIFYAVHQVLQDENGEPEEIITELSDITRNKQAEVTMQGAKEEAERAIKAKNDFLASISHELRTPLNAVTGFAQLVGKNRDLSRDSARYVKEIERAGNHLLTLVNDLIDLAALEAGELSFAMQPVRVESVVERAISRVTPAAIPRQIRFDNRVTSAVWPPVYADPERLMQVLVNLLSNAVKYNREKGQVVISAQVEPDTLMIKVQDEGKGIAAEKHSQVFQRFVRLGEERGNVEGAGIGLMFSRSLVEQMQGVIGFTSQEGQGSTFWVELPLARQSDQGKDSAENDDTAKNTGSTEKKGAEEGKQKSKNKNKGKNKGKGKGKKANAEVEAAPPASKPQGASNGHLRILSVEDNPMNQRLMCQALARFKQAEVVEAASAEEALERVKAHLPAVILMDINLPGMDGFAALEKLRADPDTRHLPVIAVSARAMKGDREKGLGAGFDAYLTKPINMQHLYQAIEQLVCQRKEIP